MTLIFDQAFDDPLERLLCELKSRIDHSAEIVARESFAMGRHETHISSRLAQVVGDEVRRLSSGIRDFTLYVAVEEFTPVEEKQVGADLYISVYNRAELGEPKGFLVQCKRSESLGKFGERVRLAKQQRNMRRISQDGSYVCVFTQTGARLAHSSVSAKRILKPPESWSIGDLVADGLRCKKGDPKIGPEAASPLPFGLNSMMRRFNIAHGIGFELSR